MNPNPAQVYRDFACHVDAVIALQETPGMFEARRALAVIASQHCQPSGDSAGTSTVTLAGAGMDARRHAIALAAAITGTTYTEVAARQPDTRAFEFAGSEVAVIVAAELVRLLQAQLDWSIDALGLQAPEFTEAMATGWMQITAEQFEGVAP